MHIVARFESGSLCAVLIDEAGRTRVRVECPDGSVWEKSHDGPPPSGALDQVDMLKNAVDAALYGPSLSGHAIHPAGSTSDRECSEGRCAG